MRIIKAVGTIVLMLGLGLFACGPGNVIKIGVVAPLTGDVKTFGESTVNGITLAVEEANRAGNPEGGGDFGMYLADDADVYRFFTFFPDNDSRLARRMKRLVFTFIKSDGNIQFFKEPFHHALNVKEVISAFAAEP